METVHASFGKDRQVGVHRTLAAPRTGSGSVPSCFRRPNSRARAPVSGPASRSVPVSRGISGRRRSALTYVDAGVHPARGAAPLSRAALVVGAGEGPLAMLARRCVLSPRLTAGVSRSGVRGGDVPGAHQSSWNGPSSQATPLARSLRFVAKSWAGVRSRAPLVRPPGRGNRRAGAPSKRQPCGMRGAALVSSYSGVFPRGGSRVGAVGRQQMEEAHDKGSSPC
jgi:hypothetical protein